MRCLALKHMNDPSELRLIEAVGEVLVVVDGRGAAVFFKDLDTLFEKLVVRIEAEQLGPRLCSEPRT